MRLSFIKMEAAGNDYIFLDAVSNPLPSIDWAAWIRHWSNRHVGIGSDGLIIIRRGDREPFSMEMYNADGSRGTMCGNGIRCLATYVVRAGLISRADFWVGTDAGPIRVRVSEQAFGQTAAALMRPPVFQKTQTPFGPDGRGIESPGGESLALEFVWVGNRHGVLFVGCLDAWDLKRWGPWLQRTDDTVPPANYEWVQVIDHERLRCRVWERGSGETRACGTGACAAAVVAISRGACRSPVRVEMPGGTLDVRWDGGEMLWLSGPVSETFRGSLTLTATNAMRP